MTAKQLLQELKPLGRESYKNVLINNHGVKEPCFGVSIAELLARLGVWPRERDVLLQLVPRGSADEIVQWRLGCDRILFNDEDPEEGGQCLVVAAWMPDDIAARPTHPNHWLIIARRAAGFHIGSYFARESKRIRVR